MSVLGHWLSDRSCSVAGIDIDALEQMALILPRPVHLHIFMSPVVKENLMWRFGHAPIAKVWQPTWVPLLSFNGIPFTEHSWIPTPPGYVVVKGNSKESLNDFVQQVIDDNLDAIGLILAWCLDQPEGE